MNPAPLVIADYRADCIYTLNGAGVTLLGAGTPAEHVGILQLPQLGDLPPRWAFVDDLRGALVIADAEGRYQRSNVPIAIPGEHAASDATGRYVAVTTGLGRNTEPWSDVVTIVDTQRAESVRFRTQTGEPGVAIVTDHGSGEPMIILRHRNPGAVEAIPLCQSLTVGPHVPVLSGQLTTDIADDGHGDVVDLRHGIFATATTRGLERLIIEQSSPRSMGVIEWPVEGRAFYLRFDSATGRAVGVIRGGPTSPESWTAWKNHLVDADLSTGERRTVPLPDGLAFRFAIGGNRTAVATIHPDGDYLTILKRDLTNLEVSRQVPLPPMAHPPSPGRLPWDPIGDSPAQRRAIAVDPTGEIVAVTRGGDSELHLVTDDKIQTLSIPTPLNEGGLLFWPADTADPVGR